MATGACTRVLHTAEARLEFTAGELRDPRSHPRNTIRVRRAVVRLCLLHPRLEGPPDVLAWRAAGGGIVLVAVVLCRGPAHYGAPPRVASPTTS